MKWQPYRLGTLFLVILCIFVPRQVRASALDSDGGEFDLMPLQLISPAGGEEFLAGTKEKIYWTATSKIDYIRIEYSLNDGQDWIVIVKSRIIDRPADYFVWEVPCTITDKAKVRVSDPYGPDDDSSLEPFAIIDAMPPAIELSPQTTKLWPPNGQMVEVGLSLAIEDNCDPNPRVFLRITSDEPTQGSQGAPDAKITDGKKVFLRAERANAGDGRVYVVTITATDFSGNSTSKSVAVKVNLREKKEAVDSGQFYDATAVK